MLAAFILTFVLAGLLLLFTNCILLNAANRELSIATSHAEYILEDIRAAGFTDISNNGVSRWDLTTAQLQVSPYSFTALSGETITASIFQSGNPLGVSVKVDWHDRGQRDRSTELKTNITNY